MSIRKELWPKIFRAGLMMSAAISLAGVAHAGTALQPDSGWAVSKIAASAQAGGGAYCALARRYSNDAVLTFARNAQDESSLAIDFQKEGMLDSKTTYYVVVTPGRGQERSFEVHPVSGRAVVVRLGKDYAFYDALNRSSELDVKIASDNYAFSITDFDDGQQQLNGCLANLAEPSANTEDTPEKITPPPRQASAPAKAKPVSAQALIRAPLSKAPATSKAYDADDETASDDAYVPPVKSETTRKLEALHEENVRLRTALEKERREFESRALTDDKNGSLASELNEKIALLERENAELRLRASANGADRDNGTAMSEGLKGLADENSRLRQQVILLQSENEKIRAQKTAAGKAEAEQQLGAVLEKMQAANRKMAEADRKMAEADRKMMSDNGHQADTDRKLTEALAKLDIAERRALEADRRLAEADRKLAQATEKEMQINKILTFTQEQKALADRKLAEADQKLKDANRRLAEADSRAGQAEQRLKQKMAQTDRQEMDADKKLKEADLKLKEADRKLAEADRRLADADKRIARADIKPVKALPSAPSRAPVMAEENNAPEENTVAEVSPAAAPPPLSRADIMTEDLIRAPIKISPAPQEAAASAPAPAPAIHDVLISASDLKAFLAPEMKPAGGIHTGKAVAGAVAYNWQGKGLYGSAEQQYMTDASAFDERISTYLAETKQNCDGTFAAKPGMHKEEKGVAASIYEFACVMPGGAASASVLFYSEDGHFTAIAHQSSLDDMGVAMEITEKLANKLLQRRLVSN